MPIPYLNSGIHVRPMEKVWLYLLEDRPVRLVLVEGRLLSDGLMRNCFCPYPTAMPKGLFLLCGSMLKRKGVTGFSS